MAAAVAVVNQYRPATNDECPFRAQPPSLLAQHDATCVLPVNPRFSALQPPQPNPNNLDPELEARQGQLCGRQRPPYRNRNECGRCPANGKQWITRVNRDTGRVEQAVEEDALRIGYDWWLWVDGGERVPGTDTQEPYLSTDPALYNAEMATATALSRDGEIAVAGTSDGYLRVFNAKTGAMSNAWRTTDENNVVIMKSSVSKAKIVSILETVVDALSREPRRARTDVIVAGMQNGRAKIYHSTFPIDSTCTLRRATGEYVLYEGAGSNTYMDIACAYNDALKKLFVYTVCDGDGQLRVFETPEWSYANVRFGATNHSQALEIENAFEQPGQLSCVSFGPYSEVAYRLVACGSRNSGQIYIWNTAQVVTPRPIVHAFEMPQVTAVALSSDSRFLAAGNALGTVNVWSTTEPYDRLFTHAGDGNEIVAISFALSDNEFVWVTADGNRGSGMAHTRRGPPEFATAFDFALAGTPLPRSLDVAVATFSNQTKGWLTQYPPPPQNAIIPSRLIVGFNSERNDVGLYDWNTNNNMRQVFEQSWRGHTSLPVQFAQGATTDQVRSPLPGLPFAQFQARHAGLANRPETIAEWQSRLFGEMRVGRLVAIPPDDDMPRSVRPRRAAWPFRFQGDTKFFWRAIQVLDLRRKLIPLLVSGEAPAGERQWPPFFWTKVPLGQVPAEVVDTFPGLTNLLQNGTMSAEDKALWKAANDRWPQYYVSEFDDNGEVSQNYTVWREFRSTVNLKDKWRNIGARRYVRETQNVGCVLNSRDNSIVCAQGHGVDAKAYKTTWVTAFLSPPAPPPSERAEGAAAAAGVPLLAGGTWAEIVGDSLVFPRVAAGGVDITAAMNGRPVTIKVDGRKLQHFAVRKTVELLNRPATLVTDPLLRNIVGRHPLKPAAMTADQFLALRVAEYEDASRKWSNMSEAEDVHDRRLWKQVAKTLALLEWQPWSDTDLNKARNWTAIHDMYSRSHSFPFYVVDENGVKLQKFCVIGAKEAARKAKSRGYNVARVQTPLSNLFKKNEWHVYDTCSQPDKEIELYSEKNIPVLEQYRHPAIAVVQENIQLPVDNEDRVRRGFGQPNLEINDNAGPAAFSRLLASPPPPLPYYLYVDDVLLLPQQQQQQPVQPPLQPAQPVQPPLQPAQPPVQPSVPLRSSTEFVPGELPAPEPGLEGVFEPFGAPFIGVDRFDDEFAQDLNIDAQDFDAMWANFPQ